MYLCECMGVCMYVCMYVNVYECMSIDQQLQHDYRKCMILADIEIYWGIDICIQVYSPTDILAYYRPLGVCLVLESIADSQYAEVRTRHKVPGDV